MSDRAHRMLYREIPATRGCIPDCHECCGPVMWTPAELAAVPMPITAQPVVVRNTRVWIDPQTGMCPMLGPSGCTVYDKRPYICRLYGAAKGCLCPRGANAAKPLSFERANTLTAKYRQLEGPTQ